MRSSRRQFLLGTASASGLAVSALASRACAEPDKPLRTDGFLPTPKLDTLNEQAVRLARTRPHRNGGVKLLLEDPPSSSPSGTKYIIHNYGHSGAGITLSWGCAAEVVDHCTTALDKLTRDHQTPSVAVLGTGVIGLTSATEIRAKWPTLPITVYSKDDVRATTSFAAGGQFEPTIITKEYKTPEAKAKILAWLRKSWERIESIQNSGMREAYGVAKRINYTLDHDSLGFKLLVDGKIIPEPKVGLLPFAKLQQVRGRAYTTWLMNPTILLPRLIDDLKPTVAFKTKKFDSREHILNELHENIIVNCTGFGAKTLFGDDDLEGKRGHLLVLRKDDSRKQLYFLSGGCSEEEVSYIFCRQNDIVVGGSVLPSDDNDETLMPGEWGQSKIVRVKSPGDWAESEIVRLKARAFLDGKLDECNQLMRNAHNTWHGR